MNDRLLVTLISVLAVACADDGSGEQDGGSGEESTSGGPAGSDSLTMTGMMTGNTSGMMTASMSAGSDGSTSGDTGPDGTTGDEDDDATGPGGSTGGEGEGSCVVHEDCASGYCRSFSDAPPDEEATCLAAPGGGATRITGTVRDVATLAPVAGAQVRVTAALAAATNPVGAPSMVDLVSGADGQVSETSAMPLTAQIGIMGLVEIEGAFLTTTGLAPPDFDGTYPPGNVVHDLWSVQTDTLARWSNALDGTAPPSALPLGDNGGTALVVRDRGTGEPLVGATAVSTDGGSGATVAYPTADGTSLETETSSTGVILIVEPGLAEGFSVTIGGESVGQVTLTSTSSSFFVAAVNVD